MFVLFSTPSDRNVRFSIRKNRFSTRILTKFAHVRPRPEQGLAMAAKQKKSGAALC